MVWDSMLSPSSSIQCLVNLTFGLTPCFRLLVGADSGSPVVAVDWSKLIEV